MRILLSIGLCLISLRAIGACHIPADPRDLMVSLRLPKSVVRQETEIFFGQSQVGYFKVPLQKMADGSGVVRFFPVTYKFPTEFYLPKQGVSFKKKFSSPLSCYEQISHQKGELSRPFYFFSWVLRNEVGRQFYFPAIVNRIGELVWAQSGTSNRNNENYMYTAADTGDGLILLSQFATSAITKFFFDGRRSESWDLLKLQPPLYANHSFALRDDGKIVFLATESKKISIFNDYLFHVRGFFSSLKLFWMGPRIFIGNDAFLADFESRTIKKIYSTFSIFSTRTEMPEILHDDPEPDPFLNSEKNDKALFENPENLGNPMGHVDWSHENSVSYSPVYGYLITVRNLNSLVRLDKDGKYLGTIGTKKGDKWRWPSGSVPFSMPHSARFSGNSILLFDNAAPSRFVQASPQSRILKMNIPGPSDSWVRVEKEIVIPGPISETRGSVYPISPNRVLAFITRFPRYPIGLREYNLDDGKVLGELEFEWPFERRSQEAVPMRSLGCTEIEKIENKNKYRIISGSSVQWQKNKKESTPIEKDIY